MIDYRYMYVRALGCLIELLSWWLHFKHVQLSHQQCINLHVIHLKEAGTCRNELQSGNLRKIVFVDIHHMLVKSIMEIHYMCMFIKRL